MQIRYKFYRGGEVNPFQKEYDEAYAKITDERERVDPNRERSIGELFPRLDSWPDYVLSNSLYVFWKMEHDICVSGMDKVAEIEEIWDEAKSSGSVGEWLKMAEAEETEKAMCFYMASLYNQYNPDNKAVDFRLYISEKIDKHTGTVVQGYSLEPYE